MCCWVFDGAELVGLVATVEDGTRTGGAETATCGAPGVSAVLAELGPDGVAAGVDGVRLGAALVDPAVANGCAVGLPELHAASVTVARVAAARQRSDATARRERGAVA